MSIKDSRNFPELRRSKIVLRAFAPNRPVVFQFASTQMLNRSRDVTEYGSGPPEARMRVSLPEQKREAGAEALIQDLIQDMVALGGRKPYPLFIFSSVRAANRAARAVNFYSQKQKKGRRESTSPRATRSHDQPGRCRPLACSPSARSVRLLLPQGRHRA